MSDTSFLWQLVQKDNNNQEQQVAEEENYLGDRQYEAAGNGTVQRYTSGQAGIVIQCYNHR
jgi:hypothetical protein